MLVDYPIEDRFILQEHGRCPFLNDRNLCDIYSELGEDKLCETCTNFPRHITEFGNTREIGISLSCPVAVELIMKRREPITFKLSENSEPVSGYNNIDASLYFKLCQARAIAYSICQNRSMPVKYRAVLLLDFSHAIQKRIRSRKIDKVLDNYKNTDYCNKRIQKLEKKYGNYKKTPETLSGWLKLYDDLEHIKPEWTQILSSAIAFVSEGMPECRENSNIVNEREYEYEHLLVYYIYRYFLRAVFDEKLSEKVKLACTALIMQELLGSSACRTEKEFTFEKQITLMRIYSKETEHSEENLEALYSNFNKNNLFSLKKYMGIILGSGLL